MKYIFIYICKGVVYILWIYFLRMDVCGFCLEGKRGCIVCLELLCVYGFFLMVFVKIVFFVVGSDKVCM